MKSETHTAVLLLGSNVGNCLLNINNAMDCLKDHSCEVVLKSSVYQTAPWGFEDQPDFLNRVIVVKTASEPSALLNNLKTIEKKLGRVTSEKWKQRIIDIDILFYDDIILQTKELTIPHPYLHQRNFTLIPLVEILPQYIHPVFGKTIAQLVAACDDAGEVKQMTGEYLKS